VVPALGVAEHVVTVEGAEAGQGFFLAEALQAGEGEQLAGAVVLPRRVLLIAVGKGGGSEIVEAVD
jgi:hypothetical protein